MPIPTHQARLGDAYALPYPDNTFNAVLHSYMFDMLPVADFPTVLREFRRVLKPGGRCVCINMTVPTHWSEQLWDTIYTLFPLLLGRCRGITLAPPCARPDLPMCSALASCSARFRRRLWSANAVVKPFRLLIECYPSWRKRKPFIYPAGDVISINHICHFLSLL